MPRLARAITLTLALAAALPSGALEPTLTGKERLGPKSSDQQRVDDCKVAPELRDPDRPRPTDCAAGEEGAEAEPATGRRD